MHLDLDTGSRTCGVGCWGCRQCMGCISASVVTEPRAQEVCWGVGVGRDMTWEGSTFNRVFAQLGHATSCLRPPAPTGMVALLYHMPSVQASVCCATLTRPHLPKTKDRTSLESSETWPNQHEPNPLECLQSSAPQHSPPTRVSSERELGGPPAQEWQGLRAHPWPCPLPAVSWLTSFIHSASI